MQLGLTWPLQRLLHAAPPYGQPILKGFCWDAHCITLHGQSSLLLVHCESRYTTVLFGLSPLHWARLPQLVAQELPLALAEAGIDEAAVRDYLAEAGAIHLTRTHGRREVAFLNRAWEDVLSADLLVDTDALRQPLLNRAVNDRLCRCAGQEGYGTAREFLTQSFARYGVTG